MYDLAVLGGGVVGCFSALRAAELGLSVVLIDERGVFGGASPRSAGVFTVQLDSALDVELVAKSIDLVKKYTTEEKSWKETGFLQIGKEYALRESMESLQKCGIRYEVLSNEEIMDRWPEFVVEPELIGVYTKPDLSVEPKILGRELRERLIEKGVKVIEGVGAKRLNISSYEIRELVLSDGSHITANHYILSMGPWTREILHNNQIEVETFLLTCFAYRFELGRELNIPSFSDEYLHTYWRPWGTTLVGGRYDAEYAESPDLTDAKPPNSSLKMALKFLLRRLKTPTPPELVEYMRGPCTFTNDGMPIFGPIPRLINAFIIDGLGGYGLMRGPALGYLTVDAIVLNRDIDKYSAYSSLRALR
ncbi:MAG: FAD-dependent oxidoreductase [Nitrososphaerota archaeon]